MHVRRSMCDTSKESGESLASKIWWDKRIGWFVCSFFLYFSIAFLLNLSFFCQFLFSIVLTFYRLFIWSVLVDGLSALIHTFFSPLYSLPCPNFFAHFFSPTKTKRLDWKKSFLLCVLQYVIIHRYSSGRRIARPFLFALFALGATQRIAFP